MRLDTSQIWAANLGKRRNFDQNNVQIGRTLCVCVCVCHRCPTYQLHFPRNVIIALYMAPIGAFF